MNDVVLPKKGTDVELTIESLAFGGMGVSHIHNAVVFVKNAIPGQKVVARITKKRSSFLEARRLRVVSESPQAVEVKCKHFENCGGCTLQNLDYSVQLKYKEEQVKDIFRRIGGFQKISVEPILGCDEQFHYRNKMEFTFSNRRWTIDGQDENLPENFALGLHVPGRWDKILNIDECYLQQSIATEILQRTKKLAYELNLEPYDIKNHTGFLRNLVIRVQETGELMVNIVTSREEPKLLEPIIEMIVKEFPQVTSLVNNITTRRAGVSHGEWEVVLHGNDHIIEKLGDYEFEISANSFFQTNTNQAKNLYDIIAEESELTGNEVVYDLFCGTGSISLYLSKKAKMVYGFELVGDAVQDAMENAQKNGVDNAWFFSGDLMNLFRTNIEAQKLESPDVVVLDPPRAGLHPKTIPDIIKKSPKRIVYVSCNPATQARDVKDLCDNGYQLTKLRPVDMFPHTPHIENVATLVRLD
ncbi:MAG: 23S rRNA (uracil(1939)-C(5))-methyltransferase RlmD [Candidatus Marinimicrobia bacterium]|nr:23S rRNA (uracil(1939)-C(5))-methyltransferase RlmD [Candidatus Neomarinimicrobiota bacterium]MBL7023676.1 23S rRNA (uracil(1939)-C(5))-methyltransferase RlmD [Candidatus Neomarinimicrobiota bacterium]MBL7109833.1 23S rRNA (uracil(1939)-C(5))-methyltransferase RlmD [Candidatus Neomarinimicrobiota bacterium]